jgi:hypothetical protein
MTGSVLDDLAAALAPLGMLVRGGFVASAADEPLPMDTGGLPARTLMLVGNGGPAMYRQFFAAPEATNGAANPLDTWTKRVLEPIATKYRARPVFPSDGPPWQPFQRWASRAEGLRASPLGVLIHPTFGLWHAYRAAFLFDQTLALDPFPGLAHACDRCVDRPCLTACPVTAVTTAGFARFTCADHVAGSDGVDCRLRGCLARRACPVGQEHAYPAEAMEFHMTAFLAGRAAEKASRN